MDNNGRLGALAAATPDVDTRQSSALDRSSNIDNLRLASEAGLQVAQELNVVGIWVVCCEP